MLSYTPDIYRRIFLSIYQKPSYDTVRDIQSKRKMCLANS